MELTRSLLSAHWGTPPAAPIANVTHAPSANPRGWCPDSCRTPTCTNPEEGWALFRPNEAGIDLLPTSSHLGPHCRSALGPTLADGKKVAGFMGVTPD